MGELLDRIRGKKYDNHKKKRSDGDGGNGGDGGYTYIGEDLRVQEPFRKAKKRELNFEQIGCNTFENMILVVLVIFAMKQTLTLMVVGNGPFWGKKKKKFKKFFIAKNFLFLQRFPTF